MTDYSQQSAELVDDVCDKLRHILESFQDRFTVRNLRLSERYLKGEIHILVEFSIRGVSKKYCACFNRAFRTDGADLKVCEWRPRMASLCELPVNNRRDIGTSEVNSNGEQQAVLVGAVQCVEHPEHVPLPALVGLNYVDRFYRFWPKALYFSHLFGTVFRGGIVNGERNSLGVSLASAGLPELQGEVVQGTPQIRQSIGSNEPDLGGNGVEFINVINRAAGIRITLDLNSARFGVLERPECMIEYPRCAYWPFRVSI